MKLLILGEFILATLDQNSRLALVPILEDRFEKKSVLIASHRPLKVLHECIDEPIVADAIMDRLFANGHRIEFRAESLRTKPT